MDLTDSPTDLAFRARVREWLEENCEPRLRRPPTPFSANGDPNELERSRELQARLADAGLAGLTWPVAFGGQDAPLAYEAIFDEEADQFDVPILPFALGRLLVGPTLIIHGTTDQQQRHLRPILRGDEIWCQLFSEPEAGSDLASLRARAWRDGDEWVISGQKVWSSGAHYSDFGILPARTDPGVPKHRGITYFIVDMRLPGVEVRPLRQLNGDSHFNEVFLDGVRLKSDAVIGEVNGGWRVTQTTLMTERVATASDLGLDVSHLVRLASACEVGGVPALSHHVVRQELAALHTLSQILRFLRLRQVTALAGGRPPGPEGSIAKLSVGALWRRAGALALTLQGLGGALDCQNESVSDAWMQVFLYSPALRILGGTDEIQRNILAERVLGLPREEDPSRSRPFEEQAVRHDMADAFT